MKTYNQNNFFKHTFCEFKEVTDFNFPENTNYKSKSESIYFYTKEGIYRKSNHWGRVANCRWKLITNNNYKNQKTVIGFANWSDFYPINSIEKIFFIEVNFDKKLAKLKTKKNNSTNYLFTFSDAQNKIKQINRLFKEDKWAKYYDLEINELRFKIISKFINTGNNLKEIKQEIRQVKKQ